LARVPIIKVDNILIATVQEDLSDSDALDFQQDLHQALEKTGASGVVLDISVLKTIDSFLGRFLNEVAAGSRLLGADAVVAGMQPTVAITLVELGLRLRGVSTVLTVGKGVQMLRERPSS
jgi:rsbT antagonist protein RsbS